VLVAEFHRANTPREEARARFSAEPHVAYQRHVREIHADIENKPCIPSLSGARGVQIPNSVAAEVTLKYEWLGTMPAGVSPPLSAENAECFRSV